MRSQSTEPRYNAEPYGYIEGCQLVIMSEYNFQQQKNWALTKKIINSFFIRMKSKMPYITHNWISSTKIWKASSSDINNS